MMNSAIIAEGHYVLALMVSTTSGSRLQLVADGSLREENLFGWGSGRR